MSQAVRSAGGNRIFLRFPKCPHTYGVRNLRTTLRIPTEPFSPNGLARVRNGVPLIRSRVLAGAVWRVRRYMRKRSDFPNRLRLQMLTGWAFCRVLCINAERVVVRICCGRECWQAVRSAGLGSTGVYGRVVAGRQACGQKGTISPKFTSSQTSQSCLLHHETPDEAYIPQTLNPRHQTRKFDQTFSLS